MGAADRLAGRHGVSSLQLMESAGRAVAEGVAEWVAAGAGAGVTIVCGPGNNGGDGFVAARVLREQGCRIRVGLLGSRADLRGDAGEMAQRWDGPIEPLTPALVEGAGVIIDAMFGAGLS